MKDNRPQNWRPGRSSSDPARKVVYDVLRDVEFNDAYANLALPKEIYRARLDRRDASYATNLCYGTLRLQGRWDAIIAHCTGDRPLSKIDPEVKILLRMGAHQLLELETSPHAAVNETVTLARNELGSGSSGFVNAVLHRVSERSLSQWRAILLDDAGGKANTVSFLSSWYSHPQWIVRAISAALKASGRKHGDIVSVLRADNTPAKVALAAREISVADLGADIERGHMDWEPGHLVDSAVLLDGGAPSRVFAVKDGLAGVQDEGSQLVARVLAAVPIEGRDERWLDMCSGPGGKTATLAAIAGRRGAEIFANELHAHRLDLVANSVEPWSDLVSLRLGDGREIGAEEPDAYDRILIDAPCTGIGALRRRPEARWNKEAGDGLDLAALQGELLDSGFAALRPGGALVYSTCSPYLMETREVVDAFLARTADAELVDVGPIAAGEAITEINSSGSVVQLWPDLHHSDAMFISLVTKKEPSA